MIPTLQATAVIAGSPTAPPRLPNGNVWTIGAKESCATWLATERHSQARDQWIEGAWSGLNMGLGRTVGASTDTAGVIGEVAVTCQAKPSEILLQAVVATYIRMGIEDR